MSTPVIPVGRLLVTGVPGWLTDAFLSRLAAEPLPGLTAVRALTLPGQTRKPDYGIPVECVEGDLRDAAALERAVAGCDTVLHTAAVLHPKKIADFYAINRDGTLVLGAAAKAAGVKRFVFVSSNAAAGKAPRKGHILTEADPPKPLNPYGASKLQAERGLLALGSMDIVNLRPCMFYGPPVPPRHIDIYKRILNGRMPMVGSGDYDRSVIYIDSLVDACRLALTHPAAANQTYFIADREVHTTRSVTDAMAAALGKAPNYMKLPGLMAPTAFVIDTALSKLGLYWQNMHLVGEADWNVGCSPDKAIRELGFNPQVSLEEGMRRAIAWSRERGLLG